MIARCRFQDRTGDGLRPDFGFWPEPAPIQLACVGSALRGRTGRIGRVPSLSRQYFLLYSGAAPPITTSGFGGPRNAPCFAGSNYLFTQVPLIRLQLTRKSKSGLSDSLNSLRILPDSNLAENALRYIFSKNSNPGAP